MNTIQRIAKNIFALIVAQFVVSSLSIILSIFIARSLGDVLFGKFSFAVAFTTFFTIFLDLGYNTLLIREVSRDKTLTKDYLNNVVGIRLISSIIIFILIVFTVYLSNYPQDTVEIIYLFFIYNVLGSFSAVFKVTFRAYERMEYEALITIFTNIIRVSLGIITLVLGYGLMGLAHSFIFSGVLDFLLCVTIYWKSIINPWIKFDFNFWKDSIRIALPLGILSVFSIIYIRIDTIMLAFMKGDAVVGWYNAAYNLILGFTPIPQLFMNAIFPLLSGYFVSSKESLKLSYELSFRYLLILGIPLVVGINILSDKIILLLYGEQFYPSIVVLRILAFDILLIFSCMCFAFVLVSINKQNQMAFAAGGAALINIILNLLLIPFLSYMGAAISTIITESILVTVYFLIISNNLCRISINKLIVKPLAASLIMAGVIKIFMDINLYLLIILSIIIYLFTLIFLKGFSEIDFEIIKKLKDRKFNRSV